MIWKSNNNSYQDGGDVFSQCFFSKKTRTLMPLSSFEYYYHLFKKLDLDMLSAFTYLPCYSAFNCMKHLRSPFSNKILGVVFSNIASGDSKAPNQHNLPENEI